MENTIEVVTRTFNCKICNSTHTITLNKNLADGRSRFPFPYIYLHGDLKDILTTLYLDKELQIRAVDTQLLSQENIFSKEQMIQIIGKLVDEIEALREEFNTIFNKYQALQRESNESGFFGFLKSITRDFSDFIKSFFEKKE